MTNYFEELRERKLMMVSGKDARSFLQNIVTCNISDTCSGELSFGALLSPQGKILFDFFLLDTADGFLLDVDEKLFDELHKRFMFYRLRADVEISPYSSETKVFGCWGDRPKPGGGSANQDPRLKPMGWRVYAKSSPEGQSSSYLAHRIENGMPEGGKDFEYGDAFPHESLMDQFGGVDFSKGCYIGQEVVSRMQHRGTARKRVVKVQGEAELPSRGSQIKIGDTPVGTMGSTTGKRGLALLRIDRVQAGREKGEKLLVNGNTVEATLPDWVNFSWPKAD